MTHFFLFTEISLHKDDYRVASELSDGNTNDDGSHFLHRVRHGDDLSITFVLISHWRTSNSTTSVTIRSKEQSSCSGQHQHLPSAFNGERQLVIALSAMFLDSLVAHSWSGILLVTSHTLLHPQVEGYGAVYDRLSGCSITGHKTP